MKWQDFLTPDEQEELAAAENALTMAMRSVDPVKERRNAVRKKLKVRCDARRLRAREGDAE